MYGTANITNMSVVGIGAGNSSADWVGILLRDGGTAAVAQSHLTNTFQMLAGVLAIGSASSAYLTEVTVTGASGTLAFVSTNFASATRHALMVSSCLSFLISRIPHKCQVSFI